MKIRPVVAELLHANGRTDGHDEANSRFSQSANARMKVNFLSITNNMQRYTIFFIIVNAVRVSGGFSAHQQELKNCIRSIGYVPSLLLLPLRVGKLELTYASGSSKQAWHIPDAAY
jgi:hypothetical protein